jgi:uncharacterized protein YdcH (DUF465 family)
MTVDTNLRQQRENAVEDIIEKALAYWRTSSIVGRAHYIAWEKAARRNRWLGIPVVITSTIVGTAIFWSIQQEPALGWKILAGILSLLSATLAALQTTLKYSELAEKHKLAGAKYSKMRRRLDMFLLKIAFKKEEYRQDALQELEDINNEFAQLAEDSPSLPDDIYDQALHEFSRKEFDRIATTLVEKEAMYNA